MATPSIAEAWESVPMAVVRRAVAEADVPTAKLSIPDASAFVPEAMEFRACASALNPIATESSPEALADVPIAVDETPEEDELTPKAKALALEAVAFWQQLEFHWSAMMQLDRSEQHHCLAVAFHVRERVECQRERG